MADTAPPDDFAEDPADAFARVTVETGPADPDDKPKPTKKKKAGAGAREPSVATGTIKVVDPDDMMDPLDAAKEITKMADQLFGLLSALRGYARMQLPDGSSVLEMAAPGPEDKARFEKALARLMKAGGVSMSPVAGLAFTGVTCYVGPILALEIAMFMSKPKAGPAT